VATTACRCAARMNALSESGLERHFKARPIDGTQTLAGAGRTHQAPTFVPAMFFLRDDLQPPRRREPCGYVGRHEYPLAPSRACFGVLVQNPNKIQILVLTSLASYVRFLFYRKIAGFCAVWLSFGGKTWD